MKKSTDHNSGLIPCKNKISATSLKAITLKNMKISAGHKSALITCKNINSATSLKAYTWQNMKSSAGHYSGLIPCKNYYEKIIILNNFDFLKLIYSMIHSESQIRLRITTAC